MFSRYFSSGWILLVPNLSLLKCFDITLPRHKSSKIEGSGPPLMSHFIQLQCVCFGFSTVSKREIIYTRCHARDTCSNRDVTFHNSREHFPECLRESLRSHSLPLPRVTPLGGYRCVCCFVLLNQYWGIVMYGPGPSSWASQGRRTHDPRSPTSQPHPVPP